MAHVETPKTDLVFLYARGGGFGPDKDLLAWAGPSDDTPVCSKQNAVFSWRTSGDVFFAYNPFALEEAAA